MDGFSQRVLNIQKSRPFFNNIILRSIKYWIVIYFPLFLFSFFLYFIEYDRIEKIDYPYFSIVNILDTLFISPLIETSVIAILYITCNNWSFKSEYRNIIFIFIVTLIAFFAHGGAVGSVWPTIGFFVSQYSL